MLADPQNKRNKILLLMLLWVIYIALAIYLAPKLIFAEVMLIRNFLPPIKEYLILGSILNLGLTSFVALLYIKLFLKVTRIIVKS